MGKYLQTRPAKEKGPEQAKGVSVVGFLKKLDGVQEYLAVDRWDDGKARKTSTVTVFVEEGRVKAALNDRELERSLYVTADSLEACLEALNLAIVGGGGDWRSWRRKK